MLVINFSHPLNSDQLAQLVNLIGGPVGEVRDIRCQASHDEPFGEQAGLLVQSVGWRPNQWQTQRFIVVPPGLAALALAVTAVIHGRCGYFPPVLRLKSDGETPPRFMVAEVINLSDLRDTARQMR